MVLDGISNVSLASPAISNGDRLAGAVWSESGVNVLAKYRRLTEIAAALSLMQGKTYHDRLLEAL